MQRHFDEELNQLKKELLRMGGMVEYQIAKSIQSLSERNSELAKEVLDEDEKIDELDNEIDNLCLRLLALHQPTAVDLRFITASILINNNLERIGDQAVNIAERAIELNQLPLLKPLIDIPRMSTIAQEMVKDSLDSFVNRDPQKALAVRNRDSELDNLNDQIFRELLTYMMADSGNITRAVHLMLISRNLERIGDHATNIAEEVVFMVEGELIKHIPPDKIPHNPSN